MGLLEKAGKIQTDEPSPPAEISAPDTIVLPDPEPVKEKPTKKAKIRKERAKKTKKEKKTRVPKVMPEGFEAATKGQSVLRRFVDFLVSYGWSVPLFAITAWGTYFNPTPMVILGVALMSLNLVIVPKNSGRTIGNWVSRTSYVNTRGDHPFYAYPALKGLSFIFVMGGLFAILSFTSQGMPESDLGKIATVTGMLMLVPPLIDWLMHRFGSSDLGLWETLFGGVWLVRTSKSDGATGWWKRLESIADYTESRGLLEDESTE
jgi:hypothetical protein